MENRRKHSEWMQCYVQYVKYLSFGLRTDRSRDRMEGGPRLTLTLAVSQYIGDGALARAAAQ